MNILRCKEVTKKTGLPRTTIHLMIKGHQFPAPISLGARTKGWIESEIEDWLLERVRERDELTV